jgi:hypothetical protein
MSDPRKHWKSLKTVGELGVMVAVKEAQLPSLLA